MSKVVLENEQHFSDSNVTYTKQSKERQETQTNKTLSRKLISRLQESEMPGHKMTNQRKTMRRHNYIDAAIIIQKPGEL